MCGCLLSVAHVACFQVPREEVMRVMQQADVLGDRVIHRAELLGAISAWYGNVERKVRCHELLLWSPGQDTDLPSLLKEALARSVQDYLRWRLYRSLRQEADYAGAWDQGRSAFGAELNRFWAFERVE